MFTLASPFVDPGNSQGSFVHLVHGRTWHAEPLPRHASRDGANLDKLKVPARCTMSLLNAEAWRKRRGSSGFVSVFTLAGLADRATPTGCSWLESTSSSIPPCSGSSGLFGTPPLEAWPVKWAPPGTRAARPCACTLCACHPMHRWQQNGDTAARAHLTQLGSVPPRSRAVATISSPTHSTTSATVPTARSHSQPAPKAFVSAGRLCASERSERNAPAGQHKAAAT